MWLEMSVSTWGGESEGERGIFFLLQVASLPTQLSVFILSGTMTYKFLAAIWRSEKKLKNQGAI